MNDTARHKKDSGPRCIAAWLLAAIAGCQPDSPAALDIVKTDLLEIIRLQNGGCGKVEHYQIEDDQSYLVTCESGEQYRIKVELIENADGDPED